MYTRKYYRSKRNNQNYYCVYSICQTDPCTLEMTLVEVSLMFLNIFSAPPLIIPNSLCACWDVFWKATPTLESV